MTRLSQLTEFQPGLKTRRIERLVAFGRGAVAWERIWPALWPASGIVGLFLAAALFGVLAPLPWPLHALILSSVVTGVGLLLFIGLKDVRLPRWEDGARRIERDSHLAHRPISEADDTISAGAGDPFAEALWRAHLMRRFADAKRLRVALPVSGLARKDPRALRFIVLLLLLGGVTFAGRASFDRIAAAFSSEGVGAGATIDAWIDPPAYTGGAPVYLGRAGTIAVPTGSILNLRVHGAAHTPWLSLDTGEAGFDGSGGEYSTSFKITADSHVRVRASGQALASWHLNAIPDNPPAIAFAAGPGRTEHDALKLSYRASDDYGVVGARAIIVPHGRSGKPLYVELPLAATSAKTISDTAYSDLTENPYAGLSVDITLEARDAIGQTGRSRTMRFTLPARIFVNPLARAFIEQRSNLATANDAGRNRVLLTLDALAIAPDHYYPDQPGIYTGLRASYWALKLARHDEDVSHVEDLLWQMATSIEQGGLAAAAQQLRAIQQMLMQALAQGAPQEVIESLMQRYEEALQRYTQALAQNGQQQNAQPPPPGSKVLTQKDIDALLKTIEQMAQAGDRQGAMEMMALLQSLLENLHAVTAGDGQGNGQQSPQDKALSDAIQGLSNLMGQQRALMDKTFRQGQGAGDPKDGGPQGLAKQQGALHDQLGKILKGLGDQKQALPKDLGDAGNAMNDSQQELGNNDTATSGEAQKQVLDALQKGAEDLAKRMGQQGEQGGQSGDNGNEDPLGRAQGAQGNVKIPGATDLQRARGILQELRKRAGELGRPKEELDYIDRLLKQF
jgi:uncharacterized protein (TIGR02302 family)